MKVLKRRHRSGSARMTRSSPSPHSEEIAANLSPAADTSQPMEPHPLSDVLGTFGGEAWEDHRAMLLKLRQADAEDEPVE